MNIGSNNSLTIGDLTAKYALKGFSSISWISLTKYDNLGYLASTSALGIEDRI